MDIHNSAHVTALLNALLLIAVCIAALVAIPLRRMLFHAGWHTPTSMHEFFIIVSYALLVTLACAIGTAAGALMVCNALQSGEALNGKTSSHYVSIDANSTLFWNRVILDYLFGLVFFCGGVVIFPPLAKKHIGYTFSVLARNLLPLIGIYWLAWSANRFLLLVVFQLALNLSLIIVSGASTSLLREARRDGRSISLPGLAQVVIIAVVTCIVPTVLVGWPIVAGSRDPIVDREWWVAVAAIVILAVSNLVTDARAHSQTDAGSSLDERTRRRFFLNLVCVLPIVAMWFFIGDADSIGTKITVYLYVAFATVLDLELAVPN